MTRVDVSRPMPVEWHEANRLAALRARARLKSCDTRELREQIVESVTGAISAGIYAAVFATDADMVARLAVEQARHGNGRAKR